MAAKKRARTEETMFGTVNADALDKMWESFDTMQILDAVGVVDSIGRRTGYNQESIRNDLLKLHGMAHTVINPADPTISEDDQTVYELADELSMEIGEWIEHLQGVVDTLDEIAKLAPEDDEWDDDEMGEEEREEDEDQE
jgi:hypothetical protein